MNTYSFAAVCWIVGGTECAFLAVCLSPLAAIGGAVFGGAALYWVGCRDEAERERRA